MDREQRREGRRTERRENEKEERRGRKRVDSARVIRKRNVRI